MAAPINILAQAAFSNTPITAAQNRTFASNYHIFSQIGRRQRLAVMINALVTRNNANGNVDYRVLHQLLFTDSKAYTRGISELDPITAQAAVWGAIGINYLIPADLQAQMATMSDLENLSEEELWRMITMLLAAFGQ
jgi:hypothetical protein